VRLFPKDRDLSQGTERVELAVRASDFQTRRGELEIRLDQFLQRFLTWRSRAQVQALIREGRVLLDAGNRDGEGSARAFAVELRPGRRLRDGNRVAVVIPEELRVPVTPQYPDELRILWEDGDALAVDKPPLLAVHPSGRHLSGTLIQRVHAMYGARELPRGARPRLCHRLDRETSGILLVGKHPRAHSHLMQQFENREVEKEYLAIVQGSPTLDRGVIERDLGPARASRVQIKMTTVASGLASRTEWNVVRRYRGCTLVACRPLTGRQHQIRVHMESIGHPLVGDKLYGPDEDYFQKAADGSLTDGDLDALELPRQALHNHRLAFRSPTSGERIEVTSPLAPDMAAFLERR
jgi:23S rRNA pseudouridine1911/1915/1917 synthase